MRLDDLKISKAMRENLKILLNIIPNKDADIELGDVPLSFFSIKQDENYSIQLVFMQLAKKNSQFNLAFRSALRGILVDEAQTLTLPTRIFISDLLAVAPIQKRDWRLTLVRDVLIIWAIMILKEAGYTPTRNKNHQGDILTGCQIVYEYLISERDLDFFDMVETIHSIWDNRERRFRTLELDHLL